MSIRLSDTIGSDPAGWIGVRNPPTLEPTWRREPLPPSRGGAGDRAVAWVVEKRTPLVAGALSIAMVGALVGSSFHSPVTAEALQPSPGAQARQAVPASGATPAVMSRPADSLARLAVVAGVSRVWPAGAVSLVARAAEAVPVAGSPSPLTASRLPAALSLAGVGEVPPATASPALAPAPAARIAAPAPARSPSPAPSPSRPVVPVVAIPAAPLTAAEQTAADAAAAAALTAANALAAANLTAANAKAAADLTAANAAAAAAAAAKAAADAAWAVAHP